MSLAAYARREGVRAKRLIWWRDRLNAGASEAVGSGSALVNFVPAVVKVDGGASRASAVVITTPSGFSIEIAGANAIEPRWLGAIVRELEGA